MTACTAPVGSTRTHVDAYVSTGVRISIGIEDEGDLLDDLSTALGAAVAGHEREEATCVS